MKAKERVLLADDDEHMLKFLSVLLSPRFEIVGSVRDGREAVRAVRVLEPDILVLDIVMPGLGGIETASVVKKTRARTEIVFLTGLEDSEWIDAGMAAGARAFVFKGCIFRDLPIAIGEVLAGRIFVSSSVL